MSEALPESDAVAPSWERAWEFRRAGQMLSGFWWWHAGRQLRVILPGRPAAGREALWIPARFQFREHTLNEERAGVSLPCHVAEGNDAACRGSAPAKAMMKAMGQILYFAYGSNLYWEQMQGRCPSAKFLAVAKLPGHRLAFSRKSGKWNGAVADAVPDPAGEVWGVVYEVTPEDLAALDGCEGYVPGRKGNAYERRQCEVWLEGDPGNPRSVEVYFAVPQENPGLPSREYVDRIVKGARFWKLPQEYISEFLEKIETQ